jgi:hypothetical protein
LLKRLPKQRRRTRHLASTKKLWKSALQPRLQSGLLFAASQAQLYERFLRLITNPISRILPSVSAGRGWSARAIQFSEALASAQRCVRSAIQRSTFGCVAACVVPSGVGGAEVAAVVRNLFKVLVTNLIDGRVSRQTDQQSLQKFTAGLSFGKRARELALRAVQPPISARLVIKRQRSKKGAGGIACPDRLAGTTPSTTRSGIPILKKVLEQAC